MSKVTIRTLTDAKAATNATRFQGTNRDYLIERVFGVVEEVAEVRAALLSPRDLPNEVGDLGHYILALAETLEIDVSDYLIQSTENSVKAEYWLDRIQHIAGKLAGTVKKWLYHNGGKGNTEQLVTILLDRWIDLCRSLGLNPIQVMQANIDKLQARHDDGYKPLPQQRRHDATGSLVRKATEGSYGNG